MYRWHIQDPIRFQENLRLTIQALGWRNDGRHLPLQDDISSGKIIDPLEMTAMDQKAMDDEKDNAELDKEMKKAQIKTQAEKGTTNPSGSTKTPAKSGNGNK